MNPVRAGFGHVYLISDGTYTKVGFSHDPARRLVQLQTAHPMKLSFIAIFEADREMETVLHEELEHCHVRGEWYLLDEDALFKVKRLFEELDYGYLNPR